MTDIERAREIIRFFNGETDLDGAWWGERPADKPTFWWRNHLPTISAALSTQASRLAELEGEVARLKEALAGWRKAYGPEDGEG